MKFCKYCGTQISDDASTCPSCGKVLSKQGEKQRSIKLAETDSLKTNYGDKNQFNKRILYGSLIIVIVLVVAIVISVQRQSRCYLSGCRNKAVEGSHYCSDHKCVLSDCVYPRESGNIYCSYHSLLTEQINYGDGGYVFDSDLEISDVKVSNESYSTVCTGKITNNSSSTVKLVKIKGAFTDYGGTVVDTDWTYAVGTEGLAPGETCKWELHVDLDYSIHGCDVSILDFDTGK